jgi:hypothetical protein
MMMSLLVWGCGHTSVYEVGNLGGKDISVCGCNYECCQDPQRGNFASAALAQAQPSISALDKIVITT